jgi:hypothetical protein
MRSFVISYRLDSVVRDPGPLLDCIKGYTYWWRGVDSVWIVTTDAAPGDVRDKLWDAMGEAGQLLVIDVTGQSWAHAGIDEDGSSWLKEHV